MRVSFRVFHQAAAASLAVFFLTSSASASITPDSKEIEALGASHGNDSESSSLIAEVNSAERNESGNLLSVTWSIENTGNDSSVLVWLTDLSYIYKGGAYFSGVTAISSESIRYHPIMDGSGECLCAGNTSEDFRQRVSPGEKMTYWSMYSVPEDLESITIEIPGFDPIEDIPIS